MAPSEYEELVKRHRFLKEAKKLSKLNTKYQRNMVKLIAFKQETGMMPKEYLEKYQDSWHLPRHKKDGVSLEERRRKRAEACLYNKEMGDWFKLETGSTPEDYCIPHTRGGDYGISFSQLICSMYSPHTWW